MIKKIIIWVVIVVGVAVVAFFMLNSYLYKQKQAVVASDYKNAEYVIAGERVKLVDGYAETQIENSSAKTITRYFGNEVMTDLNSDGREDVVFLITQETGGSGVFYYAVAALKTEGGYVGSQALFLGDRIAPQTTELSQNPQHKNVIVVNYADRAQGEGFAVAPRVGKSIYLKLDTASMQFGEVAANFPGEADPDILTLDMQTWTWIRTDYNNDATVTPRDTKAFTITFDNDGRFSATTDCNSMNGSYTTDGNKITFGQIAMTRMFCPDSQETEFAQMLTESQSFMFTGRGELVLELPLDTGAVIFR